MIHMKHHLIFLILGDSTREKHKSQKAHTLSLPSKRVGFRGESIEQLSKWHTLLEKGAITVQQYDG